MQSKEILLMLTDQWADWEAAYATASLNAFFGYAVKTIATDKEPKVSMGGLQANIDYTISEYNNLVNLAMLILPGGTGWQEAMHNEIASFVKKVIDSQIPVTANETAAVEFAHTIFKALEVDSAEELDDWREYFKSGAY